MRDLYAHRSRSPFAFESAFSDLEQLFGTVFTPRTENSSARQAPAFQPPYELVEDETGYLLSFDLPGVPKDGIQVELKENRLRIFGERSFASGSNDEGKRFFTERRYGQFERVFALPNEVAADRIEARHENGVLQLHLPKVQKAEAKSIKIETGASTGFFSKLVVNKDEPKVQ